MLYGALSRPDARLLPQVLSPHPAPHPGPRTRPRASAPAPRLALWFSRSGPRIRSSHSCLRTPASALLPPHSCLRTPASALLPPHPGPHPGSHSGPVFRAVHSGLALRPRPAPTFCPALWVADLKGGFWKEAFAFRAQAPVPAFWPCIPALTTRSSRPGSSHSALRRPRTSTHAPRLALRPRPAPTFCPALWVADSGGGSCASSPHSDPRTPTPALRPAHRPPHPASRFGLRTPARPQVLHSGPVFREGRLLRFEPALRSSRTDLRTPPSHPASYFGRRILAAALALRPRTPALHPGPRTPPPCTSVLHSASCTPVSHPALAPRLLHSRPAFRAAVLKGGFRATFWNVAFRAAVLKEGFRAAFWNVAFRVAISL